MNERRGWEGFEAHQHRAEASADPEDYPRCRRCGESLMDDPHECKYCGLVQPELVQTERSAD